MGTITEIYDYYKLLYLNIGERRCIECGNKIQKDSVRDIIDFISDFSLQTKFYVLAPIFRQHREKLTAEKVKKEVLDAGFIRFMVDSIEYTVNSDEIHVEKHSKVDIIVDRLVVKDFSQAESPDTKRLKDSIELSYKIGSGQLTIAMLDDKEQKRDFSQIFVCSYCGHIPQKLSISSFSFNSHHGACSECHGLGEKMVFLEETIINPRLTLLEGAVLPPGF